MDLRDLRYFETIASLEHLSKAAKKLHRTQPALTSCIRRLEEDCGALLFEKSGRGIRLTAAGATLLTWAQRIRQDSEDAKRDIANIGRGLSGHIRIGIVPTAAQFLLPPVARQLLARAPEVTLRTVVGLIDSFMPMLRAGDLDMMVGTEGPAEPGFVSRLLAEDFIVVAASADHEVLRGRPSLKDLTAYRWVLQPVGAPTRDWLDHTFDRKHLPRPRVQVESTMLLTLPSLIAQTGLLTFIPRHYLSGPGNRQQLKEVSIAGTTMKRRLVVTYRENGYLSPATTLLIDLLVDAGRRQLAGKGPGRARRGDAGKARSHQGDVL